MNILSMILSEDVPTHWIVIGIVITVALILVGTIIMYLNPRKRRHL